eukprot:COSAG02_NODE_50804_length_318_cov_0.712329_1_plen_31_part_01
MISLLLLQIMFTRLIRDDNTHPSPLNHNSAR